jgi:hypothetical protein
MIVAFMLASRKFAALKAREVNVEVPLPAR